MVLLLPIVVTIGLMGIGSTIYVWIQCASITAAPAVVMCVITILLYGLLVFWGIRKTLKTDKPFYLIPVGIIFVIALIMLALQNQITDLYGSLFLPIGPGSLPNTQVN